ncbi:MAG: hypothetical protein M0005_11885 [Actinomycetota bacterium]|jgi:hypothetical protein|nr:hypothetical protein [Actinomycetota bacterium]
MTRRARSGASSSRVPGVGDVELAEVAAILDTPLAALMGTEEAHAQQLGTEAAAAPAMSRLAEVVAFVGSGRPATQAGNLRTADAIALARRLDTGEEIPERVRSLDDLPDTAHDFAWAAAAGFLARSATKVVAGPLAGDIERDPLSAWMSAATTLLDSGLLGGFRQGWRKRYVELLDSAAPGLLGALVSADGAAPLAAVEGQGWALVATNEGYDLGDEAERRHVVALVRAMLSALADLGVVARSDDTVELSALGTFLACAVAISVDDEDDPVDADARRPRRPNRPARRNAADRAR